jgi:hypothetical protein
MCIFASKPTNPIPNNSKKKSPLPIFSPPLQGMRRLKNMRGLFFIMPVIMPFWQDKTAD